MFLEDAADRTAAVEYAAIVPRTGPQLITLFGIVDQGAEKRRFQHFGVLRQTADEVSGDELGRLLGKEDVAVDEVENLDRHVLETLAAHQEYDRHLKTAPAHKIDQRCGLALQPLLPPIDDKTANGGIRLHGDFGIFNAASFDDLESKALDGGDDLLNAQPFEIFGIKSRRREQKSKSLGKVHLIGQPGRRGS